MSKENLTARKISRRAAISGLLVTPTLVRTAFGQEIGGGQQSHYWAPATVDISGYFDALDQAEQRMAELGLLNGEFLGSTGYRWRQIQLDQLAATTDGEAFAGECFASSVATGDCPPIRGPKTAFGGITMSWRSRMVLAPLRYRGCKVEAGWGKVPQPSSPYSRNVVEYGDLTPAAYEHIQAIDFENSVLGLRRPIVVETSGVREREGQQWWVYLRGFNGAYLVTTDFLGWEGLGNAPQRRDFKQFPYWDATRIVVVDPLKPHPGMEEAFYKTVNRQIADVYLDLAPDPLA